MPTAPIEYCYWVVPGKLLAGEYPRNFDDRTSADKLRRLTDAGIVSFIDLTEPGELKPYNDMLDDASHRRFPIRDMSTPRSPQHTAKILDAIDEDMANDRPIYIHCWGGVGRTGTIVGCWLSRHGKNEQDALDELARLWAECPKSAWTHSPETSQQRRYVREWNEPV